MKRLGKNVDGQGQGVTGTSKSSEKPADGSFSSFCCFSPVGIFFYDICINMSTHISNEGWG